jgi:hypothetical protein
VNPSSFLSLTSSHSSPTPISFRTPLLLQRGQDAEPPLALPTPQPSPTPLPRKGAAAAAVCGPRRAIGGMRRRGAAGGGDQAAARGWRQAGRGEGAEACQGAASGWWRTGGGALRRGKRATTCERGAWSRWQAVRADIFFYFFVF